MKKEPLTQEEKKLLTNEITSLYNEVISTFNNIKRKKEEPLNVSIIEERGGGD